MNAVREDLPIIRRATVEDVAAIVALLADDAIAAARESVTDMTPYLVAYKRISVDPDEFLAVAERNGVIVGTLQLSVVHGLSRNGASRAVVEAVRVARSERGSGIGTMMMRWAITQARARGCVIMQLTTHNDRHDAHRFYERLGFQGSHRGYKMAL